MTLKIKVQDTNLPERTYTVKCVSPSAGTFVVRCSGTSLFHAVHTLQTRTGVNLHKDTIAAMQREQKGLPI